MIAKIKALEKQIKAIRRPIELIIDLENQYSDEEVKEFEQDKNIIYVCWE